MNNTNNLEEDENTIIIKDNGPDESRTLKRVIIITPAGNKKFYEIKRTSRGGYLFQ